MSDTTSILVTGGCGFIGSNLCLVLKRHYPGARVAAMDNLYRRGSELNVENLKRACVEFVKGDVRSIEDFPEGFEYLIDCAAEPSAQAGYADKVSRDFLFDTNLIGTYNSLEYVKKWGGKLIFLSSSRVYPIDKLESHTWREDDTRFVWDEGGDISPCGVKESLNLDGHRSLYGFTKLASENLIEEYRQWFGVKAVVNRCSVVSGPGQMGKLDQGFVSLWVLQHVAKKNLSYCGYGGEGKQVRDVLHVDDLCDLATQQIEDFDVWDGWKGNVGGGQENSISLIELTQLCSKITKNTIPVKPDTKTRPGDLRIFISDCQKLNEFCGWKPRRNIETIINDICQWVKLSN